MFFGRKFSGYQSDGLSGMEFLVLSIIKNHKGSTGYDIIQLVKEKFGGLWNTSAGTIYPLLNRLAERSLIEVQESLENNRLKKIYFLTIKGEEMLKKMDDVFLGSVNSLKDYIQTIFKAIPGVKAKAEVTFCNFPYHSCHGGSNQEETLDISQQNIDRIDRAIRQLKRRAEYIKQEIKYHEDLLTKILKKRENSKRSINIEDDIEYIS
jgi:DNA-binding PadR family transcriptional regulator